MKKIFLLVALLCISTLFSACDLLNNGDIITPNPPKDGEPQENPLKGTHWKLVAFVDIENNTEDNAYWNMDYETYVSNPLQRISFVDDTLVQGRGGGNDFSGRYRIIDFQSKKLNISVSSSGKVMTTSYERLYFGALGMYCQQFGVQSFELHQQEQTLHLFYGDSSGICTRYMKFIRVGEYVE